MLDTTPCEQSVLDTVKTGIDSKSCATNGKITAYNRGYKSLWFYQVNEEKARGRRDR